MARSLFGTTAAVGVGMLQYKRGAAPYGERGVLVRAIVQACEDAGVNPADVDGFISYGDDRVNEPVRLIPELGTKKLRFSPEIWGGGGGGLLAAVELAAMAIVTGQANAVIVFRAHTERAHGRLSGAVTAHHLNNHLASAGVVAPAQICALKSQRIARQHRVAPSVIQALVRASYFHASRNPNATGYGKHFDLEIYNNSRWIAEPLRLFDCSRENDGAGAVLMVSADRAKDLKKKPVYLLAAEHGAHQGWGDLIENDDDYTSSGFVEIARRLWEKTGLTAKDIDVTELYENFSYQGLSSLVDHGLTTWESATEDITFENLIAPSGRLPINTSGGNLAEGFIHGINILIEAVRQLRGESSNPVPGARTCLVAGGPSAPIVSSAIFTSEVP